MPSIVSVGFYFERRRAVATGIAMSGSGLGTMACSTIAKLAMDEFTWRYSLVILAGLALNCAVMGALLRPLVVEYDDCEVEEDSQGAVPNVEFKLVVDEVPVKPQVDRIKRLVLNDAVTQSDPDLLRPKQLRPVMRLHGSTRHISALPPDTDFHTSTTLMEKKNLFYSGSFRVLPQEDQQPEPVSPLIIPSDKPDSDVHGCAWLSMPVRRAMSAMLDVSLLKDWRFVLVLLGNVFGMLGLYVPYVYLTDRAVMLGVPQINAAFLISIVGELFQRSAARLSNGLEKL